MDKMNAGNPQNTAIPAQSDHPYFRAVTPPPGPRWQRLLGRQELTVSLLSIYVIENSGTRLLAAILRGQGLRIHEIFFKDWITNRIENPRPAEVDLLLEELKRQKPDLVGISVRASAFHCIAADITERIRAELDVPVLWGGMHATSCPEDAARAADIVCLGEAEDTIAAMVECLRAGEDISGLPGLWVHTPGGLVRNARAPLTGDLDRLPFPDFHSPDKVFIEGRRLVRGDPYVSESIYLIMASRGCPFPSCAFCSNSVLDRWYGRENRYRIRSVGNVLEEVAYAKKHFPNLKRIRFDDEEFPVGEKWFEEFCRRWPAEAGLPFEIHMDPRLVTAERLEALKRVGLEMIFMGVQSTEKINRELYCRNVSDQQVLKAAAAIGASGLHVGYQVILDDMVSTADDKRQLFDLLLQLPRPYEMVLFSLTVYPGSRLAEELKKRGAITDADIEGQATKVFKQFRVDLAYPRGPEDRFWTSLVVMVSKDFMPKGFLRRLARSRWLPRHPWPAVALAYCSNMLKMAFMGFTLLLRGEMSWAIVRRWLSFKPVTF